MKTLLMSLTVLFSVNTFASTSMICNDQNSHSVYKLVLNDQKSKMILSPLLKDSTALSHSDAVLRFNETESLFEGKNLNKNNIIVQVNVDEIKSGTVIAATVSYNETQVTDFLCSVE